jgi:uracil-DNA glycosylase family 4
MILEVAPQPCNHSLEALRAEIMLCDQCSLNKSTLDHGLWKLPGLGEPGAHVMFIAEAPSATGGCREGLYYSSSNSILYWYLAEAGFKLPIERDTVAALGKLSREEKKLEILSGRRRPQGYHGSTRGRPDSSSPLPLDLEVQIRRIRGERRHLMEPIYTAFIREGLYASDIVRCPSYNADLDANTSLPKESIRRCLPFLLRELDIVKPKILCAMGALALKVLTGWTSLEAAREKRIIRASECSVGHGVDVFATYFPTAMRLQRSKIEDLRFLGQYLGLR